MGTNYTTQQTYPVGKGLIAARQVPTCYAVTVKRGKHTHTLRYRHIDDVHDFVAAVIRRYGRKDVPDVLVQDAQGRGVCRVTVNYGYSYTRYMPPFFALALQQQWANKHGGGGGYSEILHVN